MYLYTYINAHVQYLVYWQGYCVCDALIQECLNPGALHDIKPNENP